MANYNHNIEDWWRHLGCYDREQASGILYVKNGSTKIGAYLEDTDCWWNSLTNQEKAEIYNEFFSED